MAKKALLILILVTLSSGCVHSEVEDQVFHPIIQRAQATSLYARDVDWDQLNREFVSALGDRTLSEKGSSDALELLINALEDKHATFRLRGNGEIIAAYSGGEVRRDHRDPEFLATVVNDVDAQFSYELLAPEIGYLNVVGIGPGDVRQQAASIRNGIATLVDHGAKRWIIDLRYNGGGNINPMLAGLAPLLSEGSVGGSVNAEERLVSLYAIRQRQFYDTGRLVVEFGETVPLVPKEPKIAILLSRYTISSGELIAVAFKGQPNTRFFGEPTAGYTTVTGYEAVSDDVIMLLSLSVFTDRLGHRYHGRVGVDEYVEFQHEVSDTKGRTLSSAMEWLGEG